MTPTYDDNQLGAVLVVCARCQRASYCTNHARTLCRACLYQQRAEGQPQPSPHDPKAHV